MTISWSDIPGTLTDVLISDGFDVNTRSSMLSALVGWSCICVRLADVVVSISCCCTYQLSKSDCPAQRIHAPSQGLVAIYLYSKIV